MEAKIVSCQMNSANIPEYFYKDGVFIKTRQIWLVLSREGCSQTKGLEDTLRARGLQK